MPMIASLPVNQLAQAAPLDPSKFVIEHDVPIFDQHEVEEAVRDATGRVIEVRTVKYTRDVLEAMCDNMNRRIADTGDYTAICLGHTPTPEERRAGIGQPDLVGFCGPFYVGEIGTVEPRPAIIARDWGIFREDVDRAKRFPRRSVEVWREENPKDRYIEPIALLGAETPRRDLGLAYSLRHAGLAVERYTASAPCFPSATNTFMPGSKEKKTHYDMPENPARGSTMALSDEDINKIVAAVMELDFAKWAIGQMEQGQAKADPTQAPPGMPGATPEAMPEASTGDMGGAPPAGGEVGGADDGGDLGAVPKDRAESSEVGSPSGDDSGGLPTPESHKPADGSAPDDKDNDKDKYAKERNMDEDIKTRYAQLEAYNQKLAERLQAIEDRAVKAERYAEISAWAQKYLIDEAEEQARADRYSAEQWDEHKKIVERYERNPIGFTPIADTIKPVRAPRDEKAFYSRVQQLGEHYLKVGKYKKFDEIEAEVRKEMNGVA